MTHDERNTASATITCRQCDARPDVLLWRADSTTELLATVPSGYCYEHLVTEMFCELSAVALAVFNSTAGRAYYIRPLPWPATQTPRTIARDAALDQEMIMSHPLRPL